MIPNYCPHCGHALNNEKTIDKSNGNVEVETTHRPLNQFSDLGTKMIRAIHYGSLAVVIGFLVVFLIFIISKLGGL